MLRNRGKHPTQLSVEGGVHVSPGDTFLVADYATIDSQGCPVVVGLRLDRDLVARNHVIPSVALVYSKRLGPDEPPPKGCTLTVSGPLDAPVSLALPTQPRPGYVPRLLLVANVLAIAVRAEGDLHITITTDAGAVLLDTTLPVTLGG